MAFHIRLKGDEKTIVVHGDTLVEKDDDGYLIVKKGEKVVGKFLADEVRGWWKVDKGFAGGGQFR